MILPVACHVVTCRAPGCRVSAYEALWIVLLSRENMSSCVPCLVDGEEQRVGALSLGAPTGSRVERIVLYWVVRKPSPQLVGRSGRAPHGIVGQAADDLAHRHRHVDQAGIGG